MTNAAPFVNIPNYPDHTALLDTLRTQPRVILIDADALAKENSVPRAVNMVLLGAASVVLGFDAELLEAVVADFFASKGDRIVEMNRVGFPGGTGSWRAPGKFGGSCKIGYTAKNSVDRVVDELKITDLEQATIGARSCCWLLAWRS